MKRTLCVIAVILFTGHIAWADETFPNMATSTVPSVAAQSASQQFARMKIMEMADFLAKTERFSVKLRIGYDVVQDNGQKVEFGEIRTVSVLRPDQVRIEDLASDGSRNLMLFDGRNITMFDGETNTFAQAPQPGDIDITTMYFLRDLKMRLPLASLLMRHFPQELEYHLQRIDYVEQTDILGEPSVHLAGRTARVDFQVWIAEGDKPLPLRIILSYRQAEGQPQFWADFQDWDCSPSYDKTTFSYVPPADALQILFAAQFQVDAGGPQNGQPQKQGGKQ